MRVRNSILTIILLVVVISKMVFSQWSTDPNNTLIVGYGLNPELCSDSAGGCYITYEYSTTNYPRKLAVEKLDKYGYKPWGTLKQIQGELPEQWQAEIIEDGEGGVIIGYEDDEWIPPYDFTNRVRVQKVNSSGILLWSQTGIRVTTEETNHGLCGLVSDGDGGCIIVWQDYDGHISMNRINRLGERVWGDSGVVLAPTGTYSAIVMASDENYYIHLNNNIYRINQNGQILNQYYSGSILGQPIPDPEGGLVMSGKVWTGMIPNLVAQRKDSLGNNLWQEPYVEIADSISLGSFRIGVNKNIINFAWLGTYNNHTSRPLFQSVYMNGNILHQNKVLLSEDSCSTTIIGIIASDNYNTIFSWSIPEETDAIFAQMYDTLGNKLWNENGAVITHPRMIYQQYTTDCTGGFITAGLINNFTVVAQQVNKNGQLGNVIIPVELLSFNAEVAEKTVKLKWITATETNNRGFEVERLQDYKIAKLQNWKRIVFVEGNGTTTQPYSYSFNDENVVPEVYKYRLKQIDFDGSFKYSKEIEVDFNYSSNECMLYQNYPNPFNPITNIEYRILNKEVVSLKVYDVLGNEVEALVNEEKPAGRYEVKFDGSKLPSGVYIYKLSAGNNTAVKKLILLK